MLSFLSRARLGRHLAVSAVVPALVLSTGGAAVAATHTLTLTALNRSGAKVSVSATVVDLLTSSRYTVRTGKKKKLPKGNYAVLASITSGDATTLGGRTVKVSGSAKLTIDARAGRRVNLAVRPAPTGLSRNLSARICTRTGGADYDVEAYGDNLYVIPSTSRKLAFAALGTWSDSWGAADAYAVVHQTIGVPKSPTRTFTRSSLGSVSVVSRLGPAGSNYTDVAVQPIKRGCADDMYSGLWSADRPTRPQLRLSTGSWHIRSGTFATTKDNQTWNIGSYFAERKIVAGKSSSVRFYNAAWGPGPQLPITIRGRVMFGLNDMFTDPGFLRDGSEGGDKARATLTYKGKTVKTARDRGWEPEGTTLTYPVKKAGWYTLTNTATRYYPEITYPAGMLSTKSVVSYRFHTKPKSSALAEVNSVTMVPIGLNGWNKAPAGSTTNVALKLNRYAQDPDAKRGKNPKLKSLSTTMSADGGRTWRAVKVKKINGVWTAVVRNPGSGAVSLRARATYASGGYTDVTIYRAYGIA
ncbi:hypothetical protein GCM10020358_52800 [Amorphoplanes nipponensis]|uniref:Uncharacterized protein n=1 Tax=Actinoplanes nipponensis TaxID=135950 RepID=A0A919MTY7_9ACTN|nr:hypothetical protein [Actinoplanes nipponensis]GIE49580.1 hypothetical protein Ani05nite_31140 [Actinoplanes nipponensis]